MCNRIHVDHSIPKEKSGRAWKVFEVVDSKLASMAAAYPYRQNGHSPTGKEWVTWNRLDVGDGFCVIPDYEEACRLFIKWQKHHSKYPYRIVEVEYEKAIALQMENNIFSSQEEPFEILLVKKFRPVKTWEDYV